MDDSFKLRVEKIFGSLTSSTTTTQHPSSSLQSTLWSLSGDDVEKREWKREGGFPGRDQIPCSSSFDEIQKNRRRCLRKEIDDDEDEDGGDGDGGPMKRGEDGDWDVRSSIGLDPTLDNEEEEDEYDKVASGTENASDRLYMSAVTEKGPFLNSENVLRKSLHGSKDPRANHLAARKRLKEDETEARKLNSDHDCEEAHKELQAKATNANCELKSILKRKCKDSESKSKKRVRFDPNLVLSAEEVEEIEDVAFETPPKNSMVSVDVPEPEPAPASSTSGLPDYLRHPSKYTCYSFDSSNEDDEKSNAEACTSFLELVKKSKRTKEDCEIKSAPQDLPKLVTFIPKRKTCDSSAVNNVEEMKQDEVDQNNNHSSHGNGSSTSIAAAEIDGVESEADDMDEDEPETSTGDKILRFQKHCRNYRTKSSSDDSDT